MECEWNPSKHNGEKCPIHDGEDFDSDKPKLFDKNFKTIEEFREYFKNNTKYKNDELFYTNAGFGYSNKVLKNVLEKFGYIPKDIIYTKIQKEYLNKEDIEKEIKKGLEKAQKEYDDTQKTRREWKEYVEEDLKYKNNMIMKIADKYDIGDFVAEKLYDISERIEKLYNDLHNGKSYKDNGGESERSIRAKINGRYPLALASRLLGVSPKKIKENFNVTEWHHTGALFNESDFYDLSDIIDDLEDMEYSKETQKILINLGLWGD